MARETLTAIAYAMKDFLSSSSTSTSRSFVIAKVFLNSSVSSALVTFFFDITHLLYIKLGYELSIIFNKLASEFGLLAH